MCVLQEVDIDVDGRGRRAHSIGVEQLYALVYRGILASLPENQEFYSDGAYDTIRLEYAADST